MPTTQANTLGAISVSASPKPVVHLVVHSMQAAIEVLGPGTLRRRDPNHVVAGMETFSLATTAKVIVRASHALVAEASN